LVSLRLVSRDRDSAGGRETVGLKKSGPGVPGPWMISALTKFPVLLDVACAADEASATSGIIPADLYHDSARWRGTNQFVRIMAGGALHFMIGQQSFIDAFSREAGSVPGCGHRRRIHRQKSFGVADMVSGRIFQLSVCHGECRVVGERDGMSRMQVRSDLETRIYVIRCVRAEAAYGGVDSQSSIMAAQACQGYSSRRGGHRSIQRRAAIHRERAGRGLMVPQRRHLCRVSIVGGVAGRANTFAGVPHCKCGVSRHIVRRAFNTFIDGRPRDAR
jgi:hypothetical protein